MPRRNQIEKNRRGCTVKRRSNIFQFVNEIRKQSQEEVDDDRWFVVAIMLFSLNEKQKKKQKKNSGGERWRRRRFRVVNFLNGWLEKRLEIRH